jgi:hypothetical protein
MSIMKKILFLLAVIMTVFCHGVTAQTVKTATVTFSGNDILIDGNKCFTYKKDGNDFMISDAASKPLITGSIFKNILGRFESKIRFLQVNKDFSNKNIVGRNDLVFSLVNNKVIGTDCRIDTEKLENFIKENNELK